MLRCLDPNALWTYELAGQEDLPADARVRLRCRYLTVAQLFAFRELRSQATARHDDREAINTLLAALCVVVVEVLGVPRGDGAASVGPDALLEVLTAAQCFELAFRLENAQSIAERELGKSGSPSPTATGASVRNAEEAAGA